MNGTVIEEWTNVEPPPLPAIEMVTIDPSKTAVFLLDFLRKVCTPAFRPRAAAALPGLQDFLNEARRRGLVIVHTVTSNEEPSGHELADELQPISGERIYSGSLDKFHDNDLAAFLRSKGIDTVIVTGTSANGCLLFTTAGALLRGFRAIVPVDGMPAKTPYQEQFVAWQIANGPGPFGRAGVLTRLANIRFKE